MSNHMRDELEPILVRYHVDVAFWGHIHQYERSCPISASGACAGPGEFGTVHIVIGNAGNNYQDAWDEIDSHHFPIPSWMVMRTMDYGFGAISANATDFEFWMIETTDAQSHDYVHLHK